MTGSLEPVLGLIDCNNFYVSCERVFQPKLEGKPVVVLSNNDVCVVARSNEVKALDVPMGAPVFTLRDLIKQHNIQCFSSNYTLYGAMSARVMCLIAAHVPEIEIYSIDEAFVALGSLTIESLMEQMRTLVKLVKQGTGIPISIGLGPTKTLAKLANHLAKTSGVPVLDLTAEAPRNWLLNRVLVKDVWGIGHQWSRKLNAMGLVNAADLSQQDPVKLQRQFNRIMACTVLELKGKPCIELAHESPAKKGIVCSRSFAQAKFLKSELSVVIACHVTRACEKLRRQHSVARTLVVFIQSSRFKEGAARYYGSLGLSLQGASLDTRTFLALARLALEKIYKPSIEYKKAGVMLLNISSAEGRQLAFNQTVQHQDRESQLMRTVDAINLRLGKSSVQFGAQAFQRIKMRTQNRSPNYLTSWSQIPKVKAI